MKTIIRKFFYKIFVRYQRIEMRFVTWDEGDRLIKSTQFGNEEDQWQIAKEEDSNKVPFMVYLERRKRIKV